MSEKSKRRKFYAVRRGHKPGIYLTWEQCRAQVEGYPSADYKGFPTAKSAKDYLNGSVTGNSTEPLKIESVVTIPRFVPGLVPETPLKQVVIYTDGACIGNPGPGGYGV